MPKGKKEQNRRENKNFTRPHLEPNQSKKSIKDKGKHLYTTLSKTKNYTQKNTSTYALKTLHCQTPSYFFLSTLPKKDIKKPASKLFCTSCPQMTQTNQGESPLPGLYVIPVLPWILPFVGIHTDGKLFRDSPGQFFGTRTDST